MLATSSSLRLQGWLVNITAHLISIGAATPTDLSAAGLDIELRASRTSYPPSLHACFRACDRRAREQRAYNTPVSLTTAHA